MISSKHEILVKTLGKRDQLVCLLRTWQGQAGPKNNGHIKIEITISPKEMKKKRKKRKEKEIKKTKVTKS